MAGREGQKIYRSARWKIIRQFVLERDGFKCVRCNMSAGLECDHKLPVSQGGHAWDPSNLQALCRGCHIYKTRDERQIEVVIDDEREALKQELSKCL